MPQLSAGHVWSCLDSSRNRGRGGQDGRVEEKEMICGDGEERAGRQWRRMRQVCKYHDSLHWQKLLTWSQRVVPIAVVWMVLLEESPLNPAVSLSEAAARLLLAGLLCAFIGLCALAFHVLLHNGQSVKPCIQPNGEVKVTKLAENQQGKTSTKPQASGLESQVNVLADGLVVSLLHEPLPDPSEPHIRGLLARLEAVSRTLHRGTNEDEKEEQEKYAHQDSRVHNIRSYLQDRVSSLRSLLQVQRECDAGVCALQKSLQKRWAQLEDLHTRVTLRPDSSQEVHEPHAVLTDTESLFSDLGQLKIKVQQCRTLLETSIKHLQALRSSHQSLNETVAANIESAWTKALLQSNTDLFSEIHEDFTSLEQQTSNFVIHLRGLNASEEEKTRLSVDYQSQSSPPPSLSAVPVYVAAPEAAQTHSDPESDPECPEPSQKRLSKMSLFHMLCGMKKRKSAL